MSLLQGERAELADPEPSPPARPPLHARVPLTSAVLLTVVGALAAASLCIGAGEVGAAGVLDYLGGSDSARLHLVVGELRLPRTTTALLVGAALGIAGCLLQAVTRNPLAETGLLGVNAGASLGVVAGIAFLRVETGFGHLVWAFAGAVLASGLVLLISSGSGGSSPLRLVLAGSALGATFGGITSLIIVNSAQAYDGFRQWVLGSLAGIEGFGELRLLAPVLALGFVVALCVMRPLSALALGDDLARGLGHRPGVVRVVVALSVTLLTASAVALVGPISFLGLLAGFVARALAGPRLFAQIGLAGLIGAGVLTGADVLARVVSKPYEAPVAVIVALIGAPVLIGIVRSRRLGALGMTDSDAPSATGRKHVPADRQLVLRRGPFSLLVAHRPALAAVALAALLVTAVVFAAYAGQSDLDIPRTFRAIFGLGDHFDVLLVQQFRLGRIVAALTAGAALGLAGCLTQTLARNRLATPELLGVNDGATAAILVSVTLSGTFGAWWAGPLGALVAVLVVTLVAGGLGQRGYRVLVVGLAMSALASAATQVVLARRSLSSASSLYTWASGSLNGRSYDVAWPVLIGLAVLVPAALVVARHLNVLRFDDATAASLGVSPARVRLVCMLLAVALAGLAVGICGPVGFVALASPVIASRLAGPLKVPVLGSVLVGAALILLADTLGRTVFDGVEVPVGVVTTVLGGPFLLWVLLGRSSAARL
ncbi:Fe(3+)-hydroxamate ABC transporter permease FhuB [Streptomyces sp. TRM66268-LWL]|uniref:Fe(3+)-hydroxamate ABC transporter permease FhuB n=1 Tax=Streptomyces polyasparticus TaxID=2767826 RepID=A0ABR7SGJ9_9ACTN|nr:Fe(3+)-hydroxamate ABC transporter permease FhuB [Streptomyces polyasparticus]MBC9713443.1 Fe(3+)-hydroxamate ABC transporter permease FhuB [Streptomyces polyasparticus]